MKRIRAITCLLCLLFCVSGCGKADVIQEHFHAINFTVPDNWTKEINGDEEIAFNEDDLNTFFLVAYSGESLESNSDEQSKKELYLCRGNENVYAESVLYAMAHYLGWLHTRIQSDRLDEHLYDLKEAS